MRLLSTHISLNISLTYLLPLNSTNNRGLGTQIQNSNLAICVNLSPIYASFLRLISARSVLKMLCEHCSNIDFWQLVAGIRLPHHVSCLELVKSAERGCELCWRIWEERRQVYTWHKTPQEYDECQNTELALFTLTSYQTQAIFDGVGISSRSGEFVSHLGIYAEACKHT